jgi:uncharacterized membrane protein
LNTHEESKQQFIEAKKQMKQDFLNFENRLVRKLSIRLTLIDIAYGLVIMMAMIYFHQNP